MSGQVTAGKDRGPTSQWKHLIEYGVISFKKKNRKEIARVTQMSSAKEKEYSRTHLDGVSARLHLPDS